MADRLPAADDCAVVSNGSLVLRVKDNPLRSGHVWVPPERLTVGYGLVRARLRFKGVQGAHGCLWLQDIEPYAQPDHHEVDVAECFGVNKVHHTVHWQDNGPHAEHYSTEREVSKWAWYEVEVRPEGYTFRVNGVDVAHTVVGDSGRPKALILSLLSDDWERERYGLAPVDTYRMGCDVVEVHD